MAASSSSSSKSTSTSPSTTGSRAPSPSPPIPDELPVQLLSSGPVRTLLLNRPKALNALNLEMISYLRTHLDAIAPEPADNATDSAPNAGTNTGSDAPIILLRGQGRALCSGGDVLAVVNAANSDDPAVRKQSLDFFKAEYELDAKIATLHIKSGKIFISIMDGIVMGGGVGLSVHAPFRIATERTMFAMPETGIGFFPDVGVSRVLARLDGPGASVGAYLGMTGARLSGEEAYLAGLATHFVPSANIESLVHRLETLPMHAASNMVAVDAVLSEYATNPLAETYASSSNSPSADWASKSALLGVRRVALDWAFGSKRADAKAVVAALEDLASSSERARADGELINAFAKVGFQPSSDAPLPKEAVAWAQETLQSLRTKSPRSVHVAHMLIKTHVESVRRRLRLEKDVLADGVGRFAVLFTAFRLDMAIATRFCDFTLGRDFYEGVTFTLTKDPATGKRRTGSARWEDERIEDVRIEDIGELFFARTGVGSSVSKQIRMRRGGSSDANSDFVVPELDLSRSLPASVMLESEGKYVTGGGGSGAAAEPWVPGFNLFALPSEAELNALCTGSHPAAGSMAISDPEEIVSILAGWRAGQRYSNTHFFNGSRMGSTGSAGDGDKVGMLEKVREWARRRL